MFFWLLATGDCDLGGRICAVIVAIFAAIFLVLGCVLLPLGAGDRNAAASLDPDADFVDLGVSCEVLRVDTEERTEREERKSGNARVVEVFCYHDYTYHFIYVGGALPALTPGTNYKSRVESKKVLNGQCPPPGASNGPLFTNPTLRVGSKYSCWQPAAAAIANDVPEVYNCGNPSCVKIFSPALEVQEAVDSAETLMIGGGVCLGIGLFLALVAGLTWKFCDQHDHGSSFMDDPPPAAPVMGYGGSHEAYPPAPGYQQQSYAAHYPPPQGPGYQPQGYASHYPSAPPTQQQGHFHYPSPLSQAGHTQPPAWTNQPAQGYPLHTPQQPQQQQQQIQLPTYDR